MIDSCVLSTFDLPRDEYVLSDYGSGHINETYLVSGKKDKYILQRINDYIFPDVEGLMRNIEAVCAHRSRKIKECGGDMRRCLSLIKTKDGKNYIKTGGGYYRVYNFIPDTVAVNMPDSAVHFGEGGRCFAEFMKTLLDFDASKLVDVIPGFHDTGARIKKFETSLNNDKFARANEVRELIDFVLDRKQAASVVTDKIANGEIPLRVTHNDTKFNNLLFDATTRKPVAVIDLDTIMKGSILYDFGDAVRTGCCTAEEDEHDLSKVNFAGDFYDEFKKSYEEVLGKLLTKSETELFGFSGMLMTYECGTRFLTDYLDGDVYFKTHYDKQNIFRAKTQFKLVSEMEKVFGPMTSYARR